MKTILIALALVSSLYSFDQNHLQKFLDTKDCPNCDLSGANLSNKDFSGANLSFQ